MTMKNIRVVFGLSLLAFVPHLAYAVIGQVPTCASVHIGTYRTFYFIALLVAIVSLIISLITFIGYLQQRSKIKAQPLPEKQPTPLVPIVSLLILVVMISAALVIRPKLNVNCSDSTFNPFQNVELPR